VIVISSCIDLHNVFVVLFWLLVLAEYENYQLPLFNFITQGVYQ
jgi:hypothetical protein